MREKKESNLVENRKVHRYFFVRTGIISKWLASVSKVKSWIKQHRFIGKTQFKHGKLVLYLTEEPELGIFLPTFRKSITAFRFVFFLPFECLSQSSRKLYMSFRSKWNEKWLRLEASRCLAGLEEGCRFTMWNEVCPKRCWFVFPSVLRSGTFWLKGIVTKVKL